MGSQVKERQANICKLTLLATFLVLLLPSRMNANPYTKTYNEYMGIASTGETVTLIHVSTTIRGGYGTKVRYRIGSDLVETGIVCPWPLGGRAYFTDQGKRYPQSEATNKIFEIACIHEEQIIQNI